MKKEDWDAYKAFVHANSEAGLVDGVFVERKYRVWVCSNDAELLCLLADVDYKEFKDAAIQKIDRSLDEH